MELKVFSVFAALFLAARAYDIGAPVTYLMLVDKTQQAIPQDFESKLRDLQFFNTEKHALLVQSIVYDSRFPEESYRRACRTLTTPINAIFDFTLGGWPTIRDVANQTGTPYLQVELTGGPFFRAVADYLQSLRVRKAAFIFESELDMIAAEYALGDEFNIEVLFFVGINLDSITFLRVTLSDDDFIAIFSRSNFISPMFNKIMKNPIISAERTAVVLLDFEMSAPTSDLDDLHLNLPLSPITLIRPSLSQMCCVLTYDLTEYCKCTPETQLMPIVIARVSELMLEFVRKELSVIRHSKRKIDYCNLTMGEDMEEDAFIKRNRFQNLILDVMPLHPTLEYDWDRMVLGYQTVLEVIVVNRVPLNETHISRSRRQAAKKQKLPEYGIELAMKQVVAPPAVVPDATPKKTYIVAFMDEEPWSAKDGNRWIGYCVDLMQKLAEMLGISYTAIRINDMGSRTVNAEGIVSFTGTIGQLIRGDVDIIAAPIPITSDRDENINYVEPYFERNGLMIVTMLPQISKSLFKFMTVLSPSVWLSTFGGLVAMSIILYVLEILSPFSYRNDPARYPYACRVFSYKECLWFSATSFTPQGGGEAPRALSARVVVFGFWVFVVLMLSTFTSNLAAFLTVERAQSAITSLEALARQTRVNYGVQKGGKAYQYFQNMKDAEDTLYSLWVKKVEEAVGEAANQFRTWNYPVREMYKIIWESMVRNQGFLDTPAEGIRRVLAHPDGSYAFIHDSSWVKFEYLQDCNLAEVGDVFGEQPVAMATSLLAETLNNNLSEKILALHRDRFFEELTAKHWNQSFRASCEGDNKQEGMSMESIGGIFIFVFGGLGCAFLTVLLEVIYQKKVVMARARRTTKAMFGGPTAQTSNGEVKIKRRKSKKSLEIDASGHDKKKAEPNPTKSKDSDKKSIIVKPESKVKIKEKK